jgi:N-acylneuraminate cytidylyltransferase/CMP-N,N'-diacetyllegionaminic acid synthase
MSKVLGLITARGGSKGIPGKNITLLGDKPLIAWTIESALNASVIDKLVVSTDSKQIADVSKDWGAEVPFVRPLELSGDNSPHIDVLIHAVMWLRENADYFPDYVMLLQPTSPFRTTDDIEKSARLAFESDADCIISVQESLSHPYTMTQITDNNMFSGFLMSAHQRDEYQNRQTRPQFYSLNGAIYLIKVDVLLETNTIYPDFTMTYMMPEERSLDIDTAWDLNIANLVMEQLLSKE